MRETKKIHDLSTKIHSANFSDISINQNLGGNRLHINGEDLFLELIADYDRARDAVIRQIINLRKAQRHCANLMFTQHLVLD